MVGGSPHRLEMWFSEDLVDRCYVSFARGESLQDCGPAFAGSHPADGGELLASGQQICQVRVEQRQNVMMHSGSALDVVSCRRPGGERRHDRLLLLALLALLRLLRHVGLLPWLLTIR
jgi:hypothetical protein